MPRKHLVPLHWLAPYLTLVVALTSPSRCVAANEQAQAVIASRCLSCHDTETRSGGVDLTQLIQNRSLSPRGHTQLAIKVERMVTRGDMPPRDEKPLSSEDAAAISQWFRNAFVLRQGKPHVGPTPLRRLTRYEIQNSLEDVLAIPLAVPYRPTITGRIEPSRIETLVPSDIPGDSGFSNDAQRMQSLKPPLKEIAAAVDHALTIFLANPTAVQAVLGHPALPAAPSDDEISQLISRFVTRAYRGNHPGIDQQSNAFIQLYRKHLATSQDPRLSLRHVLETILLSPAFLYRLEHSKGLDEPYPVTGLELATRLSYFLWSRPPDATLIQLGESGALLQDAVLRQQVVRMLNSPKRIALATHFAGEWLGFADLLSNREYFLNERWNRETYDEALYFFDELIKSDRSFLDLVQSDWIFKRASSMGGKRNNDVRIAEGAVPQVYADVLSRRPANPTGGRNQYLPPVLVETRGDREGGLITSAAIMRLTASKDRTSPIRRGVWVLRTVIGESLEAPANVPSLEESRQALAVKENPTVAELLQQHVSRSECISCHKAIDPLGLGLENYSEKGTWRTRYPDKTPVVSTGVMPNGKAFRSPREMKLLLLEAYRDDIARNFVEKMLAYALGRQVQPFDRISLEPMLGTVKQSGYQVDAVIEQIVLSQPFRCRQDR